MATYADWFDSWQLEWQIYHCGRHVLYVGVWYKLKKETNTAADTITMIVLRTRSTSSSSSSPFLFPAGWIWRIVALTLWLMSAPVAAERDRDGPIAFVRNKFDGLDKRGKFIAGAAAGFVGSRIALGSAMTVIKVGAVAFITWVFKKSLIHQISDMLEFVQSGFQAGGRAVNRLGDWLGNHLVRHLAIHLGILERNGVHDIVTLSSSKIHITFLAHIFTCTVHITEPK